MSLYERLFRHALYPAYEALRGRRTFSYLREYEASQWLDPEQIAALQWRKLNALVQHCWDQVPFYRQRWQAIGFAPGDLKSMADYARLPVLTKTDIQDNFEQIKADSLRSGLLYKTTGGSTGEPLRFGYTRESNDRRSAVMWRGYGWTGARMGRHAMFLWGLGVGTPSLSSQSKDLVYHGAFNRRLLNSFGMRDDNLGEYADAIAAYRPEVIVAYVGPLVRLAQWMNAQGRRIEGVSSILGAAEALHDFQRPIIEAAFPGARAYNTFGCREFMMIACECERRDGLHVSADHLAVELVDGSRQGDGSETGELVITDLHNWGMPFIRYVNGDRATRAPDSDGRCACGRGLPRLRRIDGRTLDAIRSADGHVLPGEFFPYLFKDVVGVRHYQVVQERLDAITLNLVPGPEFGAEQEAYVRREITKVLGSTTTVELKRVNDIPLTVSGKLRVTVSRLHEPTAVARPAPPPQPSPVQTPRQNSSRSLYERLFRHALYPTYEALRGRRTFTYLREYEANQWLDPEQMAALQWRKLNALVQHCWEQVPYYRQRWQAIGFAPGDLKSMADYARLPVLTKADIRAHFESLKADTLREGLFYKATGGSTGEPLRFGYTRESNDRRSAVMWRGYGWTGARMGRRALFLWGGAVGTPSRQHQRKDHLYHGAFNRRMLNSFGMRDDNLGEYADAIAAYRPEVIVAYVGPLVRLAQWLNAQGRRIEGVSSILGAAEALHDFQRPIIEAAFPGARAYNTYGCREFMMIACECEHRDGLHVSTDHLLVELVASTCAADGSETGELAITDLHNWGMPFIRYVNGDLATRAADADARCACGRGLPRLRRIDGRRLDAIRTADGHVLPGEFFPHMLKDVAGVRRYQVVQERLDAVTLNLVPGPEFGAEQEAYVRREIAKVLGSATTVELNRVDDIPLTPSGKLRVTVSRLP